ncbi:MAG: glycosyltransferase [Anaerolineales bacterium]|nr:glycosyltransferase [Anaerolineales bacterium]
MRVLFVYKYLTMGGVETVLRSRLEGLHERGFEAHSWFLFDGPGRVIFTEFEDKVHIGREEALYQHLRDVDYDVVSSLDTEEIFPLLRRSSIQSKFVIEVHTPYPENQEYLGLTRRIPVAAYFVPSWFQATVVRKKVGESAELRIVPNPLGESFVCGLEEFHPSPRKPVVAWIGRLDEVKNWKEFIEIADQIERRSMDVEFWVVGRNGAEVEEKLFTHARKTGVLPRMRWFRGLPYTHMPRLLDAVRDSGGVVVSTSRGDSFGMTVAEAMARACAVIVPSKGPFSEFVNDHEHGFAYEVGASKLGADRVETLIEDHDLRAKFGADGRESILKTHSPEVALEVLVKELRRVIGEEQSEPIVD